MIYPENFESKIGFDKIRDLLLNECISNMGMDWVAKLKFSSHYRSVKIWLSQVEEMKEILLGISSFPNSDYFDLRDALQQIRQEGTSMPQESVFDLSTSLKIMNDIIDHLEERKEESPEISKIALNLDTDPLIIAHLQRIIDDKGEIKDHASEELFKIRKELRSLLKHNDSIIKDNMSLAIKNGWTSSDEPAMRNGRVVIPIQAAYKRKIKGFIHGESATGQTIFIEPAQLFEINNELKELEAAEKRAIVKILIEFSNLLRPQIDALISSFNHLGLIDFIIAKARLAIKIGAQMPDLKDGRVIDWKGARHPLLYLSHKAQNKSVIPLDLQLDANHRILIISGPNAGGKSVGLKTVGLVQYMIQCGLLAPMKPTSIAGIFTNFFIDIGDEQSIENDLSTYSSHLLNMKHFLRHAHAKTLFLIDEFGSGTEPNLGGAIAEAILEELNSKKCFGVITTHFANLKLLPSPVNGMVNGAMLFNTKELEPLYELRIGRPGSSFTVEIAKKIGFSSNILKKIEKKADRRQLDFEEQLQQLDIEKKELVQQKRKIDMSDTLLSETLEKYQNLYSNLDQQKKRIIGDAEQKAKDILHNSNQLVEQTIREIKESQADKTKTKILREKLEEEKVILSGQAKDVPANIIHDKMTSDLNKAVKKVQKKAKVIKLEPGQAVIIKGQESAGVIQEIKGNKGIVTFGNMSMTISLKSLEAISKTKARELERKPASSYSKITSEINEKANNFKIKLDVRGLRVEEALDEIRNYIDDAILLRIFEVQILHGKGTGVLRQIIRDYLSGISEVESYKDEHIERGGHGITLVNFRM